MSPSETVTAILSFFVPPADGSRPFYKTVHESGDQKTRSNWSPEDRTVEIENIRGKQEYTLDTAGFQHFKRAATHTTFRDDTEIVAEYYPESAELIKELTGASKVVLFDHTLRRNRQGLADTGPDNRTPVRRVHVDQTPAAAIARVHRHLPAQEVPELLKHRFQIVNLWRPISHTALDLPLAMCDYRSVDLKRDLIPMALVYPDREGETFGVTHHPDQKWKYVRGMGPEEILLLKCFDSILDGSVASLTPHSAFKDPSAPESVPSRESIELRALVFYD